MVTEQLKEATDQAHRAVEGLLIPIIKNTLTQPGYVKLLLLFYGYYKPLEDAIDAMPVGDIVQDHEQRRKSTMIVHDLEALNTIPYPLPLCAAVPGLKSLEQALGAMYVLEGSTLGGIYIAKMLQRNLPAIPADAFTFFTGYGNRTQECWLEFSQALDHYQPDSGKLQSMTEAADQTFTQLKHWISQLYRYEPVEK